MPGTVLVIWGALGAHVSPPGAWSSGGIVPGPAFFCFTCPCTLELPGQGESVPQTHLA